MRIARWLVGSVATLGLIGCGGEQEHERSGEVGTVSEEMVLEGTYGQSYQIYASNGSVLQTSRSGIPKTVPASQTSRSTAFSLLPLGGAGPDIRDGDLFNLVDADSRYLNGATSHARFSAPDGTNSQWHLVRLDGAGQLEIGEQFRFETDGGKHVKAGPDGLRIVPGEGTDTNWTLGCWFPRGSFTRSWADRPTFAALPAEDPSMTQVESAVGWIKRATVTMQLPFGKYPVVVWRDPSLGTAENPQSVGYLVDDTLYGAHAVLPYDSTLATRMRAGLVASGHYGDGRFDSIFHAVPPIEWGIAGPDPFHGDLLGYCSGDGVPTTQIRAFTVGPTPPGLDALRFADTTAMIALNDFWHGDRTTARELIRAAVSDTRDSAPDAVFWDATRGLLVDDATRCGYDNVLGVCSELPNCACSPCPTCPHGVFSIKITLLLYAIRVMGLSDDPVVAPVLSRMEARVWEAQGGFWNIPAGVSDNGVPCSATEPCGVAHAILYFPDGTFAARSAPTGESTSIAVLAHTAQPVRD